MRRSDLPPHTSASQLATYASCPRRYELKYVLHTEPDERSTNLALGSAVHGAVEWWFEERLRGEEPRLDQALRIARADLAAGLTADRVAWRDETPATLRAEAERLVRFYVAEMGDLDVAATEVPFELPIVDPDAGEPMPRRLIGYFDMERASGNVVELKTAKVAYSEIACRASLQFSAYRTAARYFGVDVELHAIVRTKQLKLQRIVLPHDRVVSRWFMRAAAQIERGILAGVFPPAPSTMCAACEYRRTCLGLVEEAADAEAA
ncbi:MAG: PD-(D/E)XK nuclease family protein [Sandaracinus sp.]